MWAVTLSILLVTLVVWILWRKKQFSVLKKLGIPGPEPSIFFGNLWEISRKSPLECHKEWVKKYGRVVGYYFGTKPVVLICDPDHLKRIQISEFQKFINRPTIFQVGSRNPNDRTSFFHALTSLRDKRWKDIRSILTPSFTTSKMKLMAPIINSAIDVLLERVDEKAKKNEAFDIYELYQGLTMDVIGRTAFGIQTNCQKDPNDPFLNSARALFSGSISSLITVLAFSFPEFGAFWRHVARLRLMSRNKGIDPRQNMFDSVVEIIRERRKDEKKRRNDLLQLMIDANMSESDLRNVSDKQLTAGDEGQDETNKSSKPTNGDTSKSSKSVRHMTDDEIVENALLFFLAGYETTSTALAFTTHLLIHHQDVQEKVRKEVNDLMEREGKLDYTSVQQLQYLDQVMNESLRVYPPVYLFVNREVSDDMDFETFRLKKGFPLQVNAHLMQHDEKYWEEPEKFDPERFSPENKAKNCPLAFQVFGAGPRNCVGMRFAQMEEKLALARLLHKYRLVLCEKSDKLDVTLKIGAAGLKPDRGVFLKAVPV